MPASKKAKMCAYFYKESSWACQVILLTLKLTHTVTWPWWLILIPLWTQLALLSSTPILSILIRIEDKIEARRFENERLESREFEKERQRWS